MSSRTTSIPDVKTIKAISNESLKIDLGRTYIGELESWMKRSPNDSTHRTFEIIENRYLYLTKIDASDYLDENNNVVEKVSGKWLFDVKLITDPLKPEDVRTVYRGIILFSNKITNR